VEASADGLVALLSALLRGHGGRRPAIVAHSYGTYLALGLAREVRELAGLFLVNPVVEPDVALRSLPPQRIEIVEEGLAFADDQERETFEAETTIQTAAMLETFRRVVDRAHRATDRAFLSTLRGRYAHSAPWGAALRTLDAPVHVVCGQSDHWAGYTDAVALVRLASRCHFTVLPGCGPLLPLEAGGALAGLFGGWRSELERELSRR
jgi:pimeloyl-ACP methyl ester carboxylesterase